MPKMKTKKSAAKRFSKTGTGKIKFNKCGNSHLSSRKSPKRKRRLRKGGLLDKGLVSRTKQMIQ